jgi:hypothetical protein
MSSGPWKFPTKKRLFCILQASADAGVPVEIRIDRRTGDLVIRETRTDDSATDVADPVPPEDIVL